MNSPLQAPRRAQTTGARTKAIFGPKALWNDNPQRSAQPGASLLLAASVLQPTSDAPSIGLALAVFTGLPVVLWAYKVLLRAGPKLHQLIAHSASCYTFSSEKSSTWVSS
jgi:hypothetical protein